MIRYDQDFVLGASWPEQGPLAISYKTAAGASAIPTGYIARAQWRPHPNSTTLLLEKLPTVNTSAGTFSLLLTSEDTLLLGSLSHWGLQLESPDGMIVVPLVEGRFNGSVNVVRS